VRKPWHLFSDFFAVAAMEDGDDKHIVDDRTYSGLLFNNDHLEGGNTSERGVSLGAERFDGVSKCARARQPAIQRSSS
jgi:hypothetical protein